ncbi:MAG: hypothetical protein JWO52_2606, partial [Gammaproteobacteria bacterium]|nr:hypothetical protein [Gammaproteobacteria bacterium]
GPATGIPNLPRDFRVSLSCSFVLGKCCRDSRWNAHDDRGNDGGATNQLTALQAAEGARRAELSVKVYGAKAV